MKRERDSLRAALEQTQTEREAIRGTLAVERDEAREALKQTKRDFAYERLRLYSGLAFGNNVKPTVTIRFASYSGDYDLAHLIEKTFHEYTSWEVTLDGTNNPLLPRSDKFKVLFESSWSMTFDGVAFAFADGDLLGVTVGKATADRNDHHVLVVKVLPSAPSPS